MSTFNIQPLGRYVRGGNLQSVCKKASVFFENDAMGGIILSVHGKGNAIIFTSGDGKGMYDHYFKNEPGYHTLNHNQTMSNITSMAEVIAYVEIVEGGCQVTKVPHTNEAYCHTSINNTYTFK